MKKRVLSLFLALTLCLTLLPTAAFAEGETGGSMSGNTTIGGETGGTGGGVLVGENEKPGGGFVVPSEQSGTVSAPVAKVGDTEYDTLDEILEKMEPAEITLLANVEENLTVYAATTIHMNGFSITGDIDANDSLTLENGMVKGKVTVNADDGTFIMTAPETAEAAITKGLNVISGSAYVSGAKIGVKDTLFFGDDKLTISGTEKAVELNAAAGPQNIELYGSATADGDTFTEAVFDEEQGTYTVSGEVAKELTNKQAGGSTPTEPVTLTLNPTSVDVAAGETATFTATYTGTGTLNAYIQKNGLDQNFGVSTPTNNGDGTYTITVKIAEETPTGDYTLYVHEMGNPSVQAKATINVISTVAKDDKGNYYTTIKDAIEKAPDGSTITVIAAENRISLPDGIYVENQTGITLDLNGHSLDGSPLNVGGLTALSKVRTGKLTVIDSSGGNGAVGVTVRDGGKVEFRGSVATSCLQLQVYGGDVKFYGGNIRSFELHNDVAYADFLPKGYCYYNYSGSGSDLGSIVTAADVASVVSARHYLAVAPCSHGGKNGFDNNSTTCPYCNAPAVAETSLNNDEGNLLQRRFADLQTALDADRGGGAEFTLLTDVTGDYTIDGTQNTALDLNGHSIKGTVTVKGTKGDYITTTLNNTQNSTTASIDKVVAYDGAELCGSGEPAVIGTLTLAEGATWKTILNEKALGYKVLNADGTHKWYAQDDVDVNSSQLNNVIINRLPITSKTLNLKVDGKNLTGSSPKVERGTTVQLCASCNASGATVTFWVGKKDTNGRYDYVQLSGDKVTYQQINKNWYYVAEYIFNEIGEYNVYFRAEKDGYEVTSTDKTLKVTKPDLRNAVITFRSSNESTYEPYNATTTAPGFTVTYNRKPLKLGVDYTASGTASSAGVSTQTLTIKAVEGSDYTGSKTAEWRIVPHKAKVEVGDVIKAYDGMTDLPDGKISLVSAAGSAGYQAGRPLPLSEDNGFELTDAKYDSANASETEKNISFTVKLTDTNYTFEDGTTEKAFTLKGSETDKTFKINPATIDLSNNRFEQTVFNDLAKTYKIDLKQFLDTILPKGGEYGNIVYGKPSVLMDSAYYPVSGANIENGKLSLSIKKAASSKQDEEIGTVTVKVETTNYQPFTLTIHVIAKDKLVPVMAEDNTVSATDIIYGQKLADSTLTVNGTMQDPTTRDAVTGTFAWTNPEAKPGAAGDYTASWTFTPAAGYEEYATATGTVTIKVNPAKLTVSVEASSAYYTGEAQIASIIASGQSVDSTPVTFTYSDKVDGNYTSDGPTFTDAGTYTAYYKAEAANHEPATGTFTVTIDPLPISLLSVLSISKTYDGSADVTLTADKLTFFSKAAKTSNIKLPDTALTFSEAKFTKQQADGSYLPSPEVGGGKALSFTMTLTSSNYVFEGKSEGTTEVSDVFATDDVNRFTITKAAAPTMQPIELTVINGLAKTYLVNLPALPTLGNNCKYGSIKYEACNFDLIGEGGYANSMATITSNDEFQLTVPAVESQTEGSVGTVGVKITTDNYQDMLLTVEVIAKNKIVPVPDGEITATPITFGQILRVSTITGTMKDDGKTVEGTFEWTDPSTKPDKAGDYQAEWTFTPDESYGGIYATATGKLTIKVNRKTVKITGITAADKVYDGTTAVTLDCSQATFAGKLDGDNLSVTATGAFVSADADSNFTRAVKLSDLELGGTDKDNYEISNEGSQVQTSAKITPATLTVTPNAGQSKTYGEDDPELTYTATGAKNGETPVFEGALARATGENADNYTINKGTLALKDGEGFRASNYALVFSDTEVKFTISKATYGDKTASGSAMYGNTGTVDLSGLIAEGGSMVVNNSQSKDDDRVLDSWKVDDEIRSLSFGFVDDASKVGKTAKIVILVRGANYKDYTITITLTVNDKLTPVLDGALTLTPAEITYGDALSKIMITGTMKVGDMVVEGEFTWQDPECIHDLAGTYQDNWRFTPKDGSTYTEVTGSAKVTVNNAKQSAALVMEGYTYGETPFTPYLTDRTGNMAMPVTYYYFSVDGGTLQTWDTKNPPELSAGTYTMRAMIAGTQNYDSFTTDDVQFTVAKATPDFTNSATYTKPTGLTATYGQTLADVTLTNPAGNLDGTWSWMDSTVSVGNVSTTAKTFKAKFTPKDIENYNTVENIELEVMVNKADQAMLTIEGEDSVAYGETLTLKTTGGTTDGKVTYSVDKLQSSGDATVDENGILTPTKVGMISVTATMAGDENYNDVTSYYFVISIRKGKPTGEPKYTEITTSGKTLKDAVLTTEGSTLSPKDGKLEWVDDEGDVLPGDTWVEANKTYKWRFTPTDTNYTTMTGEIELYHKSSSGGGSGSNSGNYTITVKDAQNGDVTTDRKSASAGTTVTITVKPDSGYVLDDLTVTDSKGNDIKLTGKGSGKYTFTMPSGKATVEASFTPAKSENPFTDVPSGAYYEDAVAWAVNNGITGGTSATTFAPNGVCTRAQAVTFLWRAAGSPAPKSTAMAFTDVPAGSYYYDAVLWAIENGVTKGTSDTTFSPNANCSRGQIVTFLWRSQKSPDAAAANPFTDVAANAYYTSAVLWAVEKSITGGTSATTFSPSANCTRAQIVTFIYRCMK